jgi:nitroreductase/NAD-dependent dihydropyrimidine dehydrogenase PreA subunit
MSKIVIDREKCTLCQACLETCPFHIFFVEGSQVRTRREEECMACGHCVSVCPAAAITHAELDPAGFLPIPKTPPLSPEALYAFLRSRRSCRVYANKEVSKPILETLIDIGRFAPTGHNRQNFEFIVIQDKVRVQKLSQAAAHFFFHDFIKEVEASQELNPLKRMIPEFRMDYEFSLQGRDRIFRGAPVVILVHASAEIAASVDNCLYAIFHVVMMAEALGLGTCLNRRFILAAERSPEIAGELQLPAGHKIFGCVTVGFPKLRFHRMPPRKPPKVKWL